MKTVEQAAHFFIEPADIDRITAFGSGNVNDTYLVELNTGRRRILQRVNPAVFPDPLLVARNTRLVTDHLLAASANLAGKSATFLPVRMLRGRNGDEAFVDTDGGAWRLQDMLENCRTLQAVSTRRQARELGSCLGLFHRLLADMPPENLAEPLPGFHDTPGYLNRFDRVFAAKDIPADPEIDFCRTSIEQRRSMVDFLEKDRHLLCHTIIHGDPKVANFLFSETGTEVVSLIDLDTVQPGLLLHDLGDALRSCCNRGGEQPASPAAARFDSNLFRGWFTGYLSQAGFLLTDPDRKRIVDAALLIAFELGLRFFTDFLEGNRYFKVHAPRENLQRALAQFSLAESIEEQKTELDDLAQTILTGQ